MRVCESRLVPPLVGALFDAEGCADMTPPPQGVIRLRIAQKECNNLLVALKQRYQPGAHLSASEKHKEVVFRGKNAEPLLEDLLRWCVGAKQPQLHILKTQRNDQKARSGKRDEIEDWQDTMAARVQLLKELKRL